MVQVDGSQGGQVVYHLNYGGWDLWLEIVIFFFLFIHIHDNI